MKCAIRQFSVLALLASVVALAQGTIATVAGTGFVDNVAATEARLDGLEGLALDAQGNVYIGANQRIRRIDAKSGLISTVAGTGNPYNFKDGKATEVSVGSSPNLVFDPDGTLLFLDTGRLMKLDLNAGTLTTIAGAYGDTTPQFGIMAGLALDHVGNIYLTDSYNNKIYRIDAVTNAVTRIAGIGLGPPGDGGPATQASLGRPGPIALDGSGNIFFREQYWLRRIDAQTGIITTIMPVASNGVGSGDGGPVAMAVLGNPTALATDVKGNLYIADRRQIRKIVWSSGTIAAVAGTGQQQSIIDGVPALQANLGFIAAIAIDGQSNLWLTDVENVRVFVISAGTGLVRTVAGTSANGDGGPAIGALLPNPSGMVVNKAGDIFVGEAGGGIRRIDHATLRITTIVQTSPDISEIGQMALDAQENILFSSQDRISRFDLASGEITTVAGGNGVGFSGDGGPATSAQLRPSAVAADDSGNIYIADNGNYRVRRVDAKSGIITTIAGNGDMPGSAYAGAAGLATNIAIGIPTSIAVSAAGEVYWTTLGRVLKVDGSGILSIVAGNGGCTYSGDGGPALLAPLCIPYGLAFDDQADLFIGEGACNCVRRVDAATGLIQTVAGTGKAGVSGDAIPATQADLNYHGLALAGSNLFIVDLQQPDINARIREVSPAIPPALPQPPKITQVTNAVDYRDGGSPGALMSIMGNYLASPTPAAAQLGADGRVTATLAGDTVQFGGIAAPLLYVSAGQINTIVPYGIAAALSNPYGFGSVQMQVRNATSSDNANVDIEPASLALFPGLVFNPDATLNSSDHPAPKGATLVMYGTGMGQTVPAGIDGAILQGPSFPHPLAQFSASVLNRAVEFPAEIAYLGPLPGFVAGAMQVNIGIPDSVPAGESSLNVTSGGSSSQSQTIYMLSDPPVLTGISPASPITQTLGMGVYLTLTGAHLIRIVAFHFFLQGAPTPLSQQQFQACTDTSCTVFLDFAGQAGDYGVEVVNAANQVSNLLAFTVLPIGPPAVTGVVSPIGSGALTASKGIQFVLVSGTNFRTPLSANIYFNGSVIATLTSASSQIIEAGYTSFEFSFDFQGKAGQYGIEVIAPDGTSSARFDFTVSPP